MKTKTPPTMKRKKQWYTVTIKATIIKTQDIQATSKEKAEQEAMELFNPHSGEAEESYTQEVVSTSEDHNSILMEAAWFAMRHHYEDLAQYLDLSDEVLGPIVNKLDQQLNNE
jgi:hypothetical protein